MSAMAVAEPSRKGARTPVAMGANVVPYAMARSVVSARGAVVVGVLIEVSQGGRGGGVGGGGVWGVWGGPGPGGGPPLWAGGVWPAGGLLLAEPRGFQVADVDLGAVVGLVDAAVRGAGLVVGGLGGAGGGVPGRRVGAGCVSEEGGR